MEILKGAHLKIAIFWGVTLRKTSRIRRKLHSIKNFEFLQSLSQKPAFASDFIEELLLPRGLPVKLCSDEELGDGVPLF